MAIIRVYFHFPPWAPFLHSNIDMHHVPQFYYHILTGVDDLRFLLIGPWVI